MGCGFNFTDIIAFAKRVWLRGVIGCTVSDSAVSVTPQMLYVISEGFLKLSKLVLVLSDSSSGRTSFWRTYIAWLFYLATLYCLTLLPGKLVLWDTSTWRTCTVWLFHLANLYCLTLLPGELVLWDTSTWRTFTVWLFHLENLYCLTLQHGDGELVLFYSSTWRACTVWLFYLVALYCVTLVPGDLARLAPSSSVTWCGEWGTDWGSSSSSPSHPPASSS